MQFFNSKGKLYPLIKWILRRFKLLTPQIQIDHNTKLSLRFNKKYLSVLSSEHPYHMYPTLHLTILLKPLNTFKVHLNLMYSSEVMKKPKEG